MTTNAVKYPETKRIPVVENIGGIEFEDPYEWIEERTPEAFDWQARQTDLAIEYIHAWPPFEHLRKRLLSKARATEVSVPARVGDRWFGIMPPSGGNGRSILQVSDTPGGRGRILIDPNTLESELPLTLDWFYPSPSGRLVAYGLSEGGSEESVLHIMEVDSGAVLPDRIPFTMLCTVAWLPDESGFYYRGTPTSRLIDGNERIYFHRLGDQTPHQPESIEYPGLWCYPQISPDGRYVVAVMNDLEPRPDWIKELPDGAWRPFLRELPGQYVGTFVGDAYVGITTDGHPRGRLVSIPVATAEDRNTWRELVPEGEAVMKSVTPAGDKLILGELDEVYARLSVYSLDGELIERIPLPGQGAVGTGSTTYTHAWYPMVAYEGDETIAFVYHSLAESPALYLYNLETRKLEYVSEPQVTHPELIVRRMSGQSADGTEIKFFLLHRRDLDISRPQPVLVHAYAGFNYSLAPGYFPEFAEFAESGGIFALVHSRGGSEYGEAWWKGGRRERKQNTFNDAFAAVEVMHASGLTTPELTGFVGWSNGGMLSGVMLTQRPDLFRVVAPLVPLVDLMRVEKDPWLAACSDMDYGNTRDPQEAPTVFAYSPYHNVREDVPYPAILLMGGERDVRCPAWHAMKMAARLQHSTNSEFPVLARVVPNMGHMSGLSPDGWALFSAEWLGFIMQQLGVTPA